MSSSSRPLTISVLRIGFAVVALVLIFGLGGWLTLRWAVSGEEIRVPDLTGMSADQARGVLQEHGLIAEIDEYRPADTDVPSGHVVRQFPGPGTPLKAQRTVRLMLSAGTEQVQLPSTVGDYQSRARIALEQRGMRVGYEARVHSDEFDADRIIAQEPDPDELPPAADASLHLLVSKGPRPRVYVMPDLVGLPRERSEEFLRSRGFRLEEPTFRSSPTVAPGTIVGQRPSPGYRVTAGALVHLQVAR